MEEDFLEQTRGKEIDLVVCTDAEAILGIGDQGAGVSLCLTSIFLSIERLTRNRNLQGIGVRVTPLNVGDG
jgi:Malic enzyme